MVTNSLLVAASTEFEGGLLCLQQLKGELWTVKYIDKSHVGFVLFFGGGRGGRRNDFFAIHVINFSSSSKQ